MKRQSSCWLLQKNKYLEDKTAAKYRTGNFCSKMIPNWNGKYINKAGPTARVKSVLASKVIYHLAPLIVVQAITDNMEKWRGLPMVGHR
jgi:hypothetical protein